MSRKELALMRRGYRAGYSAALRKCHAEFYSRTERWEDKLRELEDGYAALVGKMRREQAIRDAVTERAMLMRLH